MSNIRRLTAEDAAAFRAIRLSALQECPEFFTASYDREAAWEDRRYRDIIEQQWAAGYFEEGVLRGIGVLSLNIDRPKMMHKGFIWGVYVAPQARGKGIGRLMMEYLLQTAKERVEQVNIGAGETNRKALQLYESLGFEVYAREKRALKVNERYLDEIQMVKILR